jgi:hypothetical protein
MGDDSGHLTRLVVDTDAWTIGMDKRAKRHEAPTDYTESKPDVIGERLFKERPSMCMPPSERFIGKFV